jgi:hypothetical protein
MNQVVATECATCRGDIGLWSPPDLRTGYTHMKPGGAADFEANKDHEVTPTEYVPFPPSWGGAAD